MSDQHQYKDTIEVVFVHTDFTSSWPVRPNHPEGWPGAATSRHVASVHDDQTRVVFVVARYSVRTKTCPDTQRNRALHWQSSHPAECIEPSQWCSSRQVGDTRLWCNEGQGKQGFL
ncbi:hypothetical protein KC320_g21 [Hortaea werneckii]|nr:hypothetical protein KC320_g21 [Hortaea werneckii]